MDHKNPEDVTFQVTGELPLTSLHCAHLSYVVGQLTLSSCLAKQDIRVTVCVEEVSKITCSGNLSEDGLTITWNHPFLL